MASDSQDPIASPKFGWNVPANFDRLERRLIAATQDRAELAVRMADLENNQSAMLDRLHSVITSQNELIATQNRVITRLDEQQSRTNTLAKSLQDADQTTIRHLETIQTQQENNRGDSAKMRKELLSALEKLEKLNEQVRMNLYGRIANLDGHISGIIQNGADVQSTLQNNADSISSLQNSVDTFSSSLLGAIDIISGHLGEVRTQQETDHENESQDRSAQLAAITELERAIQNVGMEIGAKITSIDSNVAVATDQASKEARILADNLGSEVSTLIESMGRLEVFSAELIPMNSQYFHTLSNARADISRVVEMVSELYTLVLSNFNASPALNSVPATTDKKKKTAPKPRKSKAT
jgi:chromosome segregation ATPase